MDSGAWPHWTAIVGAITGVMGLGIALWNNHRVNKMKRIDEWREAAIEYDTVKAMICAIPDQIRYALKSRRAVRSAQGGLRSGAMERFQKELDEDLGRAEHLLSQINDINPQRFEGMSVETLVRRRIEIARYRKEADAIRCKYEKSLADDDNQRDHIRADIRHRRAAEPPRKPR